MVIKPLFMFICYGLNFLCVSGFPLPPRIPDFLEQQLRNVLQIPENKKIIILGGDCKKISLSNDIQTVTGDFYYNFFEIYILGRKNTNGGLLNKGITATIGRHGAFNMVYFGYYHSVKNYFPAYEVLNRYIIHIQYYDFVRFLTKKF